MLDGQCFDGYSTTTSPGLGEDERLRSVFDSFGIKNSCSRKTENFHLCNRQVVISFIHRNIFLQVLTMHVKTRTTYLSKVLRHGFHNLSQQLCDFMPYCQSDQASMVRLLSLSVRRHVRCGMCHILPCMICLISSWVQVLQKRQISLRE